MARFWIEPAGVARSPFSAGNTTGNYIHIVKRSVRISLSKREL
jgi:hypothetical protein